MTAYCKKCKRDMPVGEICPQCGGKLGTAAIRVKWEVWRHPLADWLCWNAVIRILLPAFALVFVLIALVELIAGGAPALLALLRGGFPVTMGMALLAVLLFTALMLALQGRDIEENVIDSRGVHIRRFMPEPTPVRLLAHFKSPSMMGTDDPAMWDETGTALLVETLDLKWSEIARVQLWREKGIVLFYAPRWWMRIALHCSPFTWEDALSYLRDKLGRKKKLSLPPELVAPPAPKKPKQTASAPFTDKDDDPGIPAAVLAELGIPNEEDMTS